MTDFVRPIHKRVEDFIILDIEALREITDNLEYHVPDSLSESKFHATPGSILKESAYCLVVGEASCRREQVVLHGCDGRHCNLRGEVAHLVLSQPKVSLTFLKDDFQRPAPGVNPVGLEEVQFAVGGDKPVPLSPLAALAEEQTDIAVGKDYVHGDVPASQTTAVLAPFLRVVEKGDELVGGLIYVLHLAHLDHTKIQVFSESIAKYKVVEIGDFAYNPARVNIGSIGRNEYGFRGCVSPVYVVFSCKDGYAYFFDLLRKTEKFQTEVKARAIGGVRQSLN